MKTTAMQKLDSTTYKMGRVYSPVKISEYQVMTLYCKASLNNPLIFKALFMLMSTTNFI